MNLAGLVGVELTFDHRRSSDETHTYSGTEFTDHVNADLVALSVDGIHWVKVTNLGTANFTATTFALEPLLQQAETAAGSTDRSNVRIKFQQYDNDPRSFDGRAVDNIQVTATPMAPLMAAAAKSPSAETARLTDAALDSILRGAIANWARAGLAPSILARLRKTQFVITDLPDATALIVTLPTASTMLSPETGQTTGNPWAKGCWQWQQCANLRSRPDATLAQTGRDTVYIDMDAAGNGWFVDTTPRRNEEFRFNSKDGQWHAIDPNAVDKIDLATVVAHELGHVAGLEDIDASLMGLMSRSLSSGLRRMPSGA